MLPRVKIYFDNGALQSVSPGPDGVFGIVTTGAVVANKFALATAYTLRSFDDLEANYGITSVNNPGIVKVVSEFYAEAGDGTEVWLMAFAPTVSMEDMVDPELLNAKSLLITARGRLRGLIVSRTPAEGYIPTIVAGLDDDVPAALLKGQQLSEWATTTLYAPIFILLEGKYFSGNPIDLTDLTQDTKDRVGILIGDTASETEGATMGLLSGRLAVVPVKRNPARVKNGPVKALSIYIKDKKVEDADVTAIHDKGYITFRCFVNRTGYFFSDGFLATKTNDDYRQITARRTADKAYRIVYDTMLEELVDEIELNADGTLPLPVAKAWEGKIETAIGIQMTAEGDLSHNVNDPKDRGVKAFIDASQNVQSTSKVIAKVRIKPFGYARFIDVYIGFTAVSTN